MTDEIRNEPAPQTPSRRNVVLVVSLLIGTLMLSAGAAFLALRPSGVSQVSAASLMARCNGINSASCIGDAAISIARADGPDAGLGAVRMLLQSRPDIREGCHSVAHEVGNRFYEEYGDEAIVPGNNWCSWGYYHGLMQTYSEGGLDGLVDYATDLCNKVDGTLTTDCMHGVGHAAYANLRDIGKSMPVCEQLSGDLAMTCADGIVMEELFISPNGRLTSAFTPKDCLYYTNPDVVAGCARGLTSDMVQAGADLQASCAAFDGSVYNVCANGFGSALAGNELSGTSAQLNPAMFTTCAADTACAGGYGWISYMYLIDTDRALAACERYFRGDGLTACAESVNLASKRETLK